MLLAKGAEAHLYKEAWYSKEIIRKQRVKKDYRVIELDKTLRVTRTVREANLLRNAKRAGVPTPIVYEIDKHETSLIMEFIEGRRLKEVLDTIDPEKRKVLSRQIGILIGRLHKHNLIHGDLTTSNMILTETGKIYLIDFGLGYNSIMSFTNPLLICQRIFITSSSFRVSLFIVSSLKFIDDVNIKRIIQLNNYLTS